MNESKSPNHHTNCRPNSKRATKHCVIVIVLSVLVEGEVKVQVSATCPLFWEKKFQTYLFLWIPKTYLSWQIPVFFWGGTFCNADKSDQCFHGTCFFLFLEHHYSSKEFYFPSSWGGSRVGSLCHGWAVLYREDTQQSVEETPTTGSNLWNPLPNPLGKKGGHWQKRGIMMCWILLIANPITISPFFLTNPTLDLLGRWG